MDKLGLSWPESVSGKEAKDIIVTSALTGAAVGVKADGKITADVVIPFMAAKLANIKDDKYYNKKDVDNCAMEAQLINILTYKIGGFSCNVKEHKLIINFPVPLL